MAVDGHTIFPFFSTLEVVVNITKLPWQHLKPSNFGVYCALKGEIMAFKDDPKCMVVENHFSLPSEHWT